MEYTEVKVGISDLNVVLPPQKIITIGLGSCVGIGLYDVRIQGDRISTYNVAR